MVFKESWKSGSVTGRVILKNITSEAEGTYKCEVSTEAPIFDTDYKQSNLTVIEVRSQGPIISSLQGRTWWNYGDVVIFKCFMNDTRPASRLQWLLNGNPASAEDVLESIDGSREPEGGWYSQSILKFELIPEYFRTKTQLELTCVGRSGSTFERRAYWPIKLPHSNQQQQQQQQQLQQLQPSEDSEYDRRIQPVVGSFPGQKRTPNLATRIFTGRDDALSLYLLMFALFYL